MISIEKAKNQLENVKKTSKGFTAKCPAHDDKQNSLQFSEKENGDTSFYCHAGCDWKDIRRAMGEEWKPSGPSLKVVTVQRNDPVVDVYDYTDAAGKLLYQIERTASKNFRAKKPDGGYGLGTAEKVLYRWPDIVKNPNAPVFVVEGEKDANNVAGLLKLVATTSPFGAGKWIVQFADVLKGRDVVILPDNDAAGREHAQQVADSCLLTAKSVRIVELPGLPEKGDVTDWISAGGKRADLIELVKKTSRYTGDWQEPIPLETTNAVPFPIDALPGDVKTWVEASARSINIAPDVPAMLAIAVIATGIMRKACVRLWDGFIEPTNVFIQVVMESGNRKSSAFRAATEPLREYETQKRAELEDQAERDVAELAVLEERQKHLQKQAAKKVGDPDYYKIKVDLDSATEELIKHRKNMTRLPKLVSDNITSERLIIDVARNNERMAVMSADTDIFSIMNGRYSGSADIATYLNLHAGDSIKNDRKDRELALEAPLATMALTVQPEVLRQMVGISGAKERGLIARFLYTVPKSYKGNRLELPQAVPEAARKAFSNLVRSLLDIEVPKEEGRITPYVMKLSPEAEELAWSWYAGIEKRRGQFGDLRELPAEWDAKLEGTLARLTGILHAAENSNTQFWTIPISKETVSRAIQIIDYLIVHAAIAGELMRATKRLTGAQLIIGWLKENKLTSFSKREAYQSLHRQFDEDASLLDEPLQTLCGNDFIREVPTGTKEHRYLVTPFITQSQRKWQQSQPEETKADVALKELGL